MAKGNPFLGTVRGSFGDITLSTYRGKQIVKRKAQQKASRTAKQLYQRMFFATITKAKGVMKAIIDHSFENVAHGLDSVNYFTSRNIALMREATTYDYAKQAWVNTSMQFVAPKSTSMAPNPYRVSEGTLITCPIEGSFIFDVEVEGVLPEVCVPLPFIDTDASTALYAFSEDIYNRGDFQVGDYLTLVFLSSPKNLGSSIFNYSFHFVRFKFCQLVQNDSFIANVLLATNVDGVQWELPNIVNRIPDSQLDGIFVDSDTQYYIPYLDLSGLIYGSFGLAGSIVDYEKSFGPILDSNDIVIAATWIHSRPDGDIIRTSTQDLILADPTGERIPFNLDIETAFDLWQKEVKPIGDSKYILEGGDA